MLAVMALGPWRSRRSGQRFRTFVKQAKPRNLAFVRELLEAGRLAPAIDQGPEPFPMRFPHRGTGKSAAEPERASSFHSNPSWHWMGSW
jgi:hypothetical protein